MWTWMRKIICPININTKAKAKKYFRGINFTLISAPTVWDLQARSQYVDAMAPQHIEPSHVLLQQFWMFLSVHAAASSRTNTHPASSFNLKIQKFTVSTTLRPSRLEYPICLRHPGAKIIRTSQLDASVSILYIQSLKSSGIVYYDSTGCFQCRLWILSRNSGFKRKSA